MFHGSTNFRATPQHIIDSFVEITAAPENVARDFLQMARNDIEEAIQLYFQSFEASETTGNTLFDSTTSSIVTATAVPVTANSRTGSGSAFGETDILGNSTSVEAGWNVPYPIHQSDYEQAASVVPTTETRPTWDDFDAFRVPGSQTHHTTAEFPSKPRVIMMTDDDDENNADDDDDDDDDDNTHNNEQNLFKKNSENKIDQRNRFYCEDSEYQNENENGMNSSSNIISTLPKVISKAKIEDKFISIQIKRSNNNLNMSQNLSVFSTFIQNFLDYSSFHVMIREDSLQSRSILEQLPNKIREKVIYVLLNPINQKVEFILNHNLNVNLLAEQLFQFFVRNPCPSKVLENQSIQGQFQEISNENFGGKNSESNNNSRNFLRAFENVNCIFKFPEGFELSKNFDGRTTVLMLCYYAKINSKVTQEIFLSCSSNPGHTLNPEEFLADLCDSQTIIFNVRYIVSEQGK